MNDEIEVNAGYILIPCQKGQKKKLCFVSGRQGSTITLLLVSGIAIANVQQFEREYAKIPTKDGDYNLMPCNKVTDMNEVAEVCDIITNCPACFVSPGLRPTKPYNRPPGCLSCRILVRVTAGGRAFLR